MKGYRTADGWRILTEAPTLSLLFKELEELERWGFVVDGLSFPHPSLNIVEIKVRR